MAFMERQIVHGEWYEVDGPCGTEFIPAELVTVRLVEDENEGVRFPIPPALADYCENREAWSIRLVEGWGARLSAPGYLDCTEWSVFETEQEAHDYLQEMYEEGEQ